MDDTNRDIHTILTNENGITFAIMKNWKLLSAEDMPCLDGFAIVSSKITTGAAFFLLMNMSPLSWQNNKDRYLLLKVTANSLTGNSDFSLVELSKDSADMFNSTPASVFE